MIFEWNILTLNRNNLKCCKSIQLNFAMMLTCGKFPVPPYGHCELIFNRKGGFVIPHLCTIQFMCDILHLSYMIKTDLLFKLFYK